MSPQPDQPLVFDYDNFQGPFCLGHRSVMCEHAIACIEQRLDADELSAWLENNAIPGHLLKLQIPLWPNFYMWVEVEFLIKQSDILGVYGELKKKVGPFSIGVSRLLPGESAKDIGATLIQQFIDIWELDPPKKLAGCKSGNHSIKYQTGLERLYKSKDIERMMPHLYALASSKICAWCWADAYGGDARRVSADPAESAKADDFSDLIPEG
jgi:hypothetical protein